MDVFESAQSERDGGDKYQQRDSAERALRVLLSFGNLFFGEAKNKCLARRGETRSARQGQSDQINDKLNRQKQYATINLSHLQNFGMGFQ